MQLLLLSVCSCQSWSLTAGMFCKTLLAHYEAATLLGCPFGHTSLTCKWSCSLSLGGAPSSLLQPNSQAPVLQFRQLLMPTIKQESADYVGPSVTFL